MIACRFSNSSAPKNTDAAPAILQPIVCPQPFRAAVGTGRFSRRLFDTNGETPMNLLPLQIVLGFQVAAAVVILIQLMKGEDGDSSFRTEKATRPVPRPAADPAITDRAR
jgi:hypothetical protein